MPFKLVVEYVPDPEEELTPAEQREREIRGLAYVLTGLQLMEIMREEEDEISDIEPKKTADRKPSYTI